MSILYVNPDQSRDSLKQSQLICFNLIKYTFHFQSSPYCFTFNLMHLTYPFSLLRDWHVNYDSYILVLLALVVFFLLMNILLTCRCFTNSIVYFWSILSRFVLLAIINIYLFMRCTLGLYWGNIRQFVYSNCWSFLLF